MLLVPRFKGPMHHFNASRPFERDDGNPPSTEVWKTPVYVSTPISHVDRKVIETLSSACKADIIAIILTALAAYTRLELVSPT